jgi:hypothetical protein
MCGQNVKLFDATESGMYHCHGTFIRDFWRRHRKPNWFISLRQETTERRNVLTDSLTIKIESDSHIYYSNNIYDY